MKENDINLSEYVNQFRNIIENSRVKISDIKPSEWSEQNVMITSGAFPGKLRYSLTPYTREVIDCLSPDHPARRVAVMKGGQIGFSSTVLIPGIGYIITTQPGNTYLTVGAPDLVEPAMEKVDLMIDGAGIRHFIKPNAQRNKSQKTGDTNFKKEFPLGSLTVSSVNNHKAIRQRDLMYGLLDDWESVKRSSKESGDTRLLLEQRFAAYANKHKIFYISTPELKHTSNIEPVYLSGDQRKYMVPCPKCGCMINLVWASETEDGDQYGITWKTDDAGSLISSSVGYICQECGNFFTDSHKHEILQERGYGGAAYWEPTAKPSQPGYYSYHISSLYAPPGMYNWEHYVRKWIEAHPEGQPRKEAEYKTFVNVVLAQTYEELTEAPKATAIMGNTRAYNIGSIPESLSIADGNGHILLITCGADLNGIKEDGRLDYEILAHSESGATYSISHGSIGTFIPREGSLKNKVDRQAWTYEPNMEYSIFPEFEKILGQTFNTDTGREMKIYITALDVGHYTEHAYTFIEGSNANIVAVKGEDEDKYIRYGIDRGNVKAGRRKSYLYLVQVGLIKDQLAEYMQLKWRENSMDQPANFMNFPTPSDGLYQFNNYFSHYEAEHRITVKNDDGDEAAARWVKRDSTVQNHLFDCRIYNLAARDIMLLQIGKILKKDKLSWSDYAALLKGDTK